MKKVHKSLHLRLFAIFSSTDINQLQPVVRGGVLSVSHDVTATMLVSQTSA